MNILSPSLLSIDFNNIERDAAILDRAEVKWYHLDVMDGAFVPNISFGPPVIKAIRKITKAFLKEKSLAVYCFLCLPISFLKQYL